VPKQSLYSVVQSIHSRSIPQDTTIRRKAADVISIHHDIDTHFMATPYIIHLRSYGNGVGRVDVQRCNLDYTD